MPDLLTRRYAAEHLEKEVVWSSQLNPARYAIGVAVSQHALIGRPANRLRTTSSEGGCDVRG